MSKSRDDWTPLNMTTQHQARGRPPQARVAFHQNRAAGNGALLGRSLPGFGGSGPPASATACPPASMCFTPVISTPLANDPGAHLSVTLAPRLPSVAESKTLQKRRGQPLRIGHLRRDTTPRTRPSAHTLLPLFLFPRAPSPATASHTAPGPRPILSSAVTLFSR
jgi:hypothetical protein